MRYTFSIQTCLARLIIACFCWILFLNPAHADYQPVPGLIDLRTTFSDGLYDPESLALLARSKGFRILIINDHDRVAMEYGLPPLRNILKKKVEHNSINLQGADRYLSRLREVEKKYPDMMILPGSESTPFYYWTGNVFEGNLTANNPERRLLTIGLEKPEDYERLPILHNSRSGKDTGGSFPVVLLLITALGASLIMIRWKGFFRVAGILISLGSIPLLLFHTIPGGTSPYDPYHGDQGMAPYQLVIDYVNARGGLTFWNYPETKSGVRKMGPITVSTPPYPGVLADSTDYTGFSALYGDTITLTEPGNIWDLTLKEYCRGLRKHPPWGIATADFHGEGDSGEKLGNYQTVFLLREKSKAAVLDAMRKGKMYACQGKFPHVPRLDEFSVSSSDGNVKGISGDEIVLKGYPRIRISLTAEGSLPGPVKIRLIRAGDVIKIMESPLPVQINYQDEFFKPGAKIYYRVDMRGAGTIVSNPVFVAFEKVTPRTEMD